MTEALWEEFKQPIEAFIRTKVHQDEVEDLLQDVFMKIHQKVHTVREHDRIESWVFQITRNAIIDHYRTKRQNTSLTVDIPERMEEESSVDFSPCIQPLLTQLSTEDQKLISRVNLEGGSQKAIAEELGIGYSALKSRVQRARQRLKDVFVECCEIESDVYGHIVSAKTRDCSC
ncbi:RNA polymerase sigma factor SigZ [Sanyastnella coralliicola]|uniref:RNA polymerase sigma factor SigZ n=1 Tax=Sanyastnella coralliicola TaxID=3069118 RepID=UPI0027B9A51C|nr:RNA polymerase sigma factor SigZ [Longitalea sp. SCSIO 12813]